MSILQVGRQLFGAEYFWRSRSGPRLGVLVNGHSDFAGVTHDGTAIFVEAKTLGAPKVRDEQAAFLDRMEKRQCFCWVGFEDDPGQLARAWENRWDRVDSGGNLVFRYSWRANYEANLAEAKRVAKGRNASPVNNRHARDGLKSALSDAIDRMAKKAGKGDVRIRGINRRRI